MHLFRGDCHTKKPFPILAHMAAKVLKLNLTLNLSNPGAGTDLAKIEPFVDMLKDGYSEVACIKDYMYHHGDLHGANKHEYEIKERANVSIIHYNMIVPKEDQKAMTHKVCFDFCRGVPEMFFFGVTAGRECYCAPYYKMMAGDSSKCDAVCEGESTTMCGGMAKSSIFEMHLCADTAEDLMAAAEKVADVNGDLKTDADKLMEASKILQDSSAEGQKTFGSAGDTVASDLMQQGKVLAGEAQHTAEDALKVSEQLGKLKEKAEGMKEGPFDTFDAIKEAEATVDGINALVPDGEAAYDKVTESLGKLVSKADGEPLEQYHPIMYFVDRAFEKVPQTCGGEVLRAVTGTNQECAAACDADLSKCVGFYFHFSGDGSICFLLSKVKSVTYYTECGDGEGPPGEFLQVQKPKEFLQHSGQSNGTAHALMQAEYDPSQTNEEMDMCWVKFTTFNGMTLKPDPSGKCKASSRQLIR